MQEEVSRRMNLIDVMAGNKKPQQKPAPDMPASNTGAIDRESNSQYNSMWK